MALRPSLLLLLLTLGVGPGGCVSAVDAVAGTNLAEVAAGRRLAEERCALCHAIDGRGQSPKAGVRNFGEIAQRHRGRSLEWQLETIAEVGHFSMPAVAMSPTEQASLVAYIRRQRP